MPKKKEKKKDKKSSQNNKILNHNLYKKNMNKYKKRNWIEYLFENSLNEENFELKQKKVNNENIEDKNNIKNEDISKEINIINDDKFNCENTKEILEKKSNEQIKVKRKLEEEYYQINEHRSQKESWDEIVINYLNNIDYDIKEKDKEEVISSDSEEIKDIKDNKENITDFQDIKLVNENQLEISPSNLKKIEDINQYLNKGNINNDKKIYNNPNKKNKKTSLFLENSNEIIGDKIFKINNDSFIFNGNIYKKYYRDNKYKKGDKILRFVYKCQNHRKDEKIRIQLKKPCFCNGTIEYSFPNQNQKSGYFFKNDHSEDCKNLGNNEDVIDSRLNANNIDNKKQDKNKFIEKCENVMNSSDIFDRRLYKDEFKKIYNEEKYDFSINNNFLSNIITRWKLKTNRFKKTSVLEHPNDYKNRVILREYRTLNLNIKNKKTSQPIEYIIWANDENLKRIRISNHLFIDATFHHPPEFSQLLIIMYRDRVTELNIPGIYILMNKKEQIHYDIIFSSIINILTDFHHKELEIKTIVTDSEIALVNVVKKYFPNSLRISCLFHFKQDLMRNIRSYGLYKKDDKKLSDKIIKKLTKLTIKYKGDINYVKNKLVYIISKYSKYENYINNYFVKEKLKYFEDNSLNYHLIPEKLRTNNFLENYNRYIKKKLGEKRIINWINFIHFIKEESDRSINKLLNITEDNFNISDMSKKKYSVDSSNNNIYEPFNNIIEENKLDINNNNNIAIENNEFQLREFNYTVILNRLFGIYNIGNTCYINATIQILLHTELFLKTYFAKLHLIRKDPNSISYLFYKLIYEIYLKTNAKCVDVTDFILSFKNNHPVFSGNIQNDSSEFLRVLLEDFSTNLNEANKYAEHIILENDLNKNKLELTKEYKENFSSRENSIISNNFYTQMIYVYTCKCKHELYAFQYYMDLPLLIPAGKNNLDLYQLLDYYFKPETIDFETKCIKCNNKCTHNKKMRISEPPKILILSLQRFDHITKSKNNCLIRYQEIIDISKYIDKECGYKGESIYNLYGIINHIGNIFSGHYYSYIKIANSNKWYEFNDSSVIEIGNIRENPYVYSLFYIKNS